MARMGPGKVAMSSKEGPANTPTYSAYEYQLHRNWIALWSILLAIFFVGLLYLDLLGYTHDLEGGANPASYRLFCLTAIALYMYMRFQNNKGNATQVGVLGLAYACIGTRCVLARLLSVLRQKLPA